MNAQLHFDANEALDLFRGLPEWINQRKPAEVQLNCRAYELDSSFNGLPTVAVELFNNAGPVAAYKCNISLIRGARRVWLVFAPLVVVWGMDRQQRGPGVGRQIINHSTESIAGFCRACVPHIPDVLVASGNLTTVKGGRPFFAGLGWEIVEAREIHGGAFEDGYGEALSSIAGRIDAALEPLRQSAPGTVEPTSFALLRIPPQPVIPLAASSAGWSATSPA